MKAIFTKYIRAANVRGSRVKAYDSDGRSITIGYDNVLNSEGNHRAAARAFCIKYRWYGTFTQADLANTSGYVFVWADGSKLEVQP